MYAPFERLVKNDNIQDTKEHARQINPMGGNDFNAMPHRQP